MTVADEKTMDAIQQMNRKIPDLEIDLKDVIAMQAMTGFISTYTMSSPVGFEHRIAKFAYDMADAMIAERRERGE